MYPKFRVWDSVDEELMYEGSMDNYIVDTGCDGYFHLLKVARFFPQMSTGVKDRNGKEIYEGDILKPRFDENLYGRPAIVTFKKVAFRVDVLGYGNEVYFDEYMEEAKMADYEIEVVGNVYENPDLLKDVL